MLAARPIHQQIIINENYPSDDYGKGDFYSLIHSPKGSKNPTGGRAPSSLSKLIFRAEDVLRAEGAKAEAAERK